MLFPYAAMWSVNRRINSPLLTAPSASPQSLVPNLEAAHTVKRQNEVMVINHVPAGVCDIRGDVLLAPETVRRIEGLVKATPTPWKNIDKLRVTSDEQNPLTP